MPLNDLVCEKTYTTSMSMNLTCFCRRRAWYLLLFFLSFFALHFFTSFLLLCDILMSNRKKSSQIQYFYHYSWHICNYIISVEAREYYIIIIIIIIIVVRKEEQMYLLPWWHFDERQREWTDKEIKVQKARKLKWFFISYPTQFSSSLPFSLVSIYHNSGLLLEWGGD